MKKELSSVGNILVDLPQDDELTCELRTKYTKLEKLAIKWLASKLRP